MTHSKIFIAALAITSVVACVGGADDEVGSAALELRTPDPRTNPSNTTMETATVEEQYSAADSTDLVLPIDPPTGSVAFGGMYSTASTYCPATNNPVTGYQSCPVGFYNSPVGTFVCNHADPYAKVLYLCWKPW